MNIFTFANLITLGRTLLIIPLVFLLKEPAWPFAVLALLAWSLDLLDGKVARARKETSKLGARLDSTVDKLTFFVLFVGLFFYHWIPAWVFYAIALLQVLQMFFVYIYRNRPKRPSTGLMFFVGVALAGSLFADGVMKEWFWWFAVLASFNHLFYYGISRTRSISLVGFSFLSWIPNRWLRSHVEEKLRNRSISFNAPMRFVTLANAVTLFRLLLGLLILDELWSQRWESAGILGVLFLGLDVLDGHIARKRKEVSSIGRWLDVMVDKFVFAFVIAILTLQGFFPVSLIILVGFRYAITGIAAAAMRGILKKPLPIQAFSMLANLALFLLFFFPFPWWTMMVVLLNFQQMIQTVHDSFQIIIRQRYAVFNSKPI